MPDTYDFMEMRVPPPTGPIKLVGDKVTYEREES